MEEISNTPNSRPVTASSDPTMVLENLENALEVICENIKMRINPDKMIVRKRLMQTIEFDIGEYCQPLQIFDMKRLWRIKLRSSFFKKQSSEDHKKPNSLVKIKPLQGFKDPIWLRKKFCIKLPKKATSSFYLTQEKWKYVPPKSTYPPHYRKSSQTTAMIPLRRSPFLLEMNKLGKYKNPTIIAKRNQRSKRKSKTKISTKRLMQTVKNFTEGLVKENEIYTAPPGSKENYSCRKFIEITEANKALDKVTSLIGNAHNVTRKPVKEGPVILLTSSWDLEDIPEELKQYVSMPDVIQYCSSDDTISEVEFSKSNQKLEGTLLGDKPAMDMNSELDKHDTIVVFKIMEDLLSTIEHITNESDSEFPTEFEIDSSEENNDNDGRENRSLMPETEESICELKISNDPIKFIIHIDKPVSVNRIRNESPSIGTWLYENIFNEFLNIKPNSPVSSNEESITSIYKPPSRDILLNYESRTRILSKPNSFADFQYFLARNDSLSKSCSHISERTLNTEPVKVLAHSRSIRKKFHKINLQPKNSIDEFLKEQQQNPSHFLVHKNLCSKTFGTYGIDEPTKIQYLELDNLQNVESLTTKKKDYCWGGENLLSKEIDLENGYLGSEEDDDRHHKAVNDYWPSELYSFPPKINEAKNNKSDTDEFEKETNNSELDELSNKGNYDEKECLSTLSSHESLLTDHCFEGHGHCTFSTNEQNQLKRMRSMQVLSKKCRSTSTIYVSSSETHLERKKQEISISKNNSYKSNQTSFRSSSSSEGGTVVIQIKRVVSKCIQKVCSWCTFGMIKTKPNQKQSFLKNN